MFVYSNKNNCGHGAISLYTILKSSEYPIAKYKIFQKTLSILLEMRKLVRINGLKQYLKYFRLEWVNFLWFIFFVQSLNICFICTASDFLVEKNISESCICIFFYSFCFESVVDETFFWVFLLAYTQTDINEILIALYFTVNEKWTYIQWTYNLYGTSDTNTHRK